MFPKQQRLTEKKAYDILFRRGAWVRGRLFSLIFLPGFQAGKIGFIITKKVTKSAVERNRIKRRLRSMFMKLLQEQIYAPILQRNTMAIVVHRPVDITPLALEHEVKNVLDKLVTGVKR